MWERKLNLKVNTRIMFTQNDSHNIILRNKTLSMVEHKLAFEELVPEY